MLRYRILKDNDNGDVMEVAAEGPELLRNPILNKGGAFSEHERQLFNLEGFLPSTVSTLERQVERNYRNFLQKDTDLGRYVFLRSLQDRNETLFYAMLAKHIDDMLPIVYTPTVGVACQKYSHIFRFTRGIYLSEYNVDRTDSIFAALPNKNIEMIVVTDAEGILGLGDQGIGGMGIPVGKLSLYTVGAGIHPANCLPVTLDVGTNNESLLDDPLYLGTKKKRLTGDKYLNMVDKFVEGVKKAFPNALIQWEDFSKQNAFTLLEKYRDDTLSFNDDIQGTGAVALAGVLAALRITGEKIQDQRFMIHGAGAGGIGVAAQIKEGLKLAGLSDEEALERITVLDSRGVICQGRAGVDRYKEPYAKAGTFAYGWDVADPRRVELSEAMRHIRPTVLLGLSGVSGVFDEKLIREMAAHCERPIIFPLSNPTASAEATPQDLYLWTQGRAIVATGSPFADVTYNKRTMKIGQGNNVFIFPGVGLGMLAVRAERITDEIFATAALRLAELVGEERLDVNCVYPPVSELREVCLEIAVAVAQKAMDMGLAAQPVVPKILKETIVKRMWEPKYIPFTKCAERH
jgi:malate dehydrogenase (oxaloacetate-decarboxylating)